MIQIPILKSVTNKIIMVFKSQKNARYITTVFLKVDQEY